MAACIFPRRNDSPVPLACSRHDDPLEQDCLFLKPREPPALGKARPVGGGGKSPEMVGGSSFLGLV